MRSKCSYTVPIFKHIILGILQYIHILCQIIYCSKVLDGADAVMLSGETAAGTYPIESLQAMRMIAKEA